MERFRDRTVIVTGAASGIGAACVKRLHADGASVVAADIREAGAREAVGALADQGRVQTVVVNVSDRRSVSELIAAANQTFGNLYGLVNSAGIRGVGTLLDLEAEALDRVLSVNLVGTLNVC